MKTIGPNELFENLGEFLKTRGVEFTEGPYSRRIQQGCALLTDAINCTQTGLQKARTEFDRKLDEMRQAIHEKTAPAASKPSRRAGATKSERARPVGSTVGGKKRGTAAGRRAANSGRRRT